MQNCLNFTVDRSAKAKSAAATHPHSAPPIEGENQSQSRRHCPKLRQQMDSHQPINNGATVSAWIVSPGPLKGAEQRRWAGGLRLALSEPQASLASRPAHRVAQGTGVAGTEPGVAFSLATFFWRSKRKYARASSAETTPQRSRIEQKRIPTPSHRSPSQ